MNFSIDDINFEKRYKDEKFFREDTWRSTCGGAWENEGETTSSVLHVRRKMRGRYHSKF